MSQGMPAYVVVQHILPKRFVSRSQECPAGMRPLFSWKAKYHEEADHRSPLCNQHPIQDYWRFFLIARASPMSPEPESNRVVGSGTGKAVVLVVLDPSS